MMHITANLSNIALTGMGTNITIKKNKELGFS